MSATPGDILDGLQRAYQVTREREAVLRQRERQLGPVLHRLLFFLRELVESHADQPLRHVHVPVIANLEAQTKLDADADVDAKVRYDTLTQTAVSGDSYLRELVTQLAPLVDELPRWSGWENPRP